MGRRPFETLIMVHQVFERYVFYIVFNRIMQYFVYSKPFMYFSFHYKIEWNYESFRLYQAHPELVIVRFH